MDAPLAPATTAAVDIDIDMDAPLAAAAVAAAAAAAAERSTTEQLRRQRAAKAAQREAARADAAALREARRAAKQATGGHHGHGHGGGGGGGGHGLAHGDAVAQLEALGGFHLASKRLPKMGSKAEEKLAERAAKAALRAERRVRLAAAREAAEAAGPAPLKTQYLVKWRELSYRECTWEDEAAVHAPEAVRRFRRGNRAPSNERVLAASGQSALQMVNKAHQGGRVATGRGSVIFPFSYLAPARGRAFSQSMARAQVHAQVLAFSYVCSSTRDLGFYSCCYRLLLDSFAPP